MTFLKKKAASSSSMDRSISFAGFTAGRSGGMQVNREKLHSSPEYQRQVKALQQISALMKANKKAG